MDNLNLRHAALHCLAHVLGADQRGRMQVQQYLGTLLLDPAVVFQPGQRVTERPAAQCIDVEDEALYHEIGDPSPAGRKVESDAVGRIRPVRRNLHLFAGDGEGSDLAVREQPRWRLIA